MGLHHPRTARKRTRSNLTRAVTNLFGGIARKHLHRGTAASHHRAVARKVLFFLLVFASVAGFSAQAHAQETIMEVRRQAQNALQAGAYEQAILYLEELVSRLKNSTERDTQIMLEGIHFNLGLCYFLSGQFAQTEKQFRHYIRLYPRNRNVIPADVFTADSLRYRGQMDKAISEYQRILETRRLNADWRTDVLSSLIRCHLAQDDWETAIPLLERAYNAAPDRRRSSWAATLLTTAYVREEKFDKVYNLVPLLLQDGSFAAHSVAFNLSTLETADRVFAAEEYRHALWLYRLVFPKEVIKRGCERQVADMERRADRIRRFGGGQYRTLLRIQETIGELEGELESLKEIDDYSEELQFRIARSYFEVRRWLEAREAFLELHEVSLEPERQEECLFLAFLAAFNIEPWGPAFEIGMRYMHSYPAGTYYDRVSLTIGQMHARHKEWPKVIEVLTEALEVSPEHESIAECMFLVGYSHFMEEHYADCVEWLARLNTDYPGNDRMMEATYWTGMGYLFDTKYEEALTVFGFFIRDFPDAPYIVDAEFRHAVCQYGLSNFAEAEDELRRFVQRYSGDERAKQLMGEAHMMIADCAGTFGRAGQAINHYQTAIRKHLNIAHYNYCVFRAAEMMGDNERWSDIVNHFETYIDRNRDGSNIPMAVFWMSKAYWQQEEYEQALMTMLDNVDKHGADREALGVDLILDEWLGKSRRLEKEQIDTAWRTMTELLKNAREQDLAPLRLRLLRAFMYRPGQEVGYKEDVLDILLKKENVPHASAAVLELILDESLKRDEPELAQLAAAEIVDVFPETDYVIPARMYLGNLAAASGDLEAAKEQFNVIITNFASSEAAGRALMTLGRAYFENADIREADDCFKRVLDVRAWRPLWAEAVFLRGECLRVKGKFEKATAFYERVYLMYSAYEEWAAKSYLQRADCLTRLRRYQKARDTLEEFLNQEELSQYTAYDEAGQLLERINATP